MISIYVEEGFLSTSHRLNCPRVVGAKFRDKILIQLLRSLVRARNNRQHSTICQNDIPVDIATRSRSQEKYGSCHVLEEQCRSAMRGDKYGSC
jgi:hypothetical protein